jgi:hypothetical protein
VVDTTRVFVNTVSPNPRGKIRFEFEIVFEWPIFEFFVRTVIMYVYVETTRK